MRAMGVGILFSICGVFGQSLTEWIYRQPAILFTFYILLGSLASLAHSRRQEVVETSRVPGAPEEPVGAADQSFAAERA